VTLIAAILTLTTTAAPAAPPVAADGLDAMEDVLLPAVPGSLTLSVRALEARIVIQTPHRSTPALVLAIRKAPRSVCAGLDERPFEIHLRCRSSRIMARLLRRETGYLLQIGETRGLPWDGEDGPPLITFEPASAGLGDPCPGSTPAGRAECELAKGDHAGARAALEQVLDGPTAELAELRRGDLASAQGDVRAASRAWGRVRGQPWQRLAAARLCETSWSCLTGPNAGSIFASQDLPEPLAREMRLRHARALAFLGRATEGARSLLAASAMGPCAGAPSLCRRLALAALRAPGPDAIDGLLLWLEIPDRDRGPGAYEVEAAAAEVAQRNGAPLFAANILAAAVGHAPAADLEGHLLRTSELYLLAGDRVRAGVVVEFARARAGEKGLRGSRWAAVARAAAARSGASAPASGTSLHLTDDTELLAAASRSAQAARAVLEKGRP